MTKIKFNIDSLLVLLFFLFLPFERLLTFELAGLTVKISFVILMLIVLVFRIKRNGSQLAIEDKLLFAFAGLSYLSAFWSIDQLRSLVISTIFLVTFLGFIALRRFLSSKNLEIAKTIIIYWGFVLCLFALWQYFGNLHNLPLTFLRPQYMKTVFGFPRPQATFLEPLFFANFLFLPIFFSLERFLKSTKIPIFLSANIFLLFLILVLTLSRGAYISIVLALTIFAVIVGLKFRNYFRRFSIALVIGLLGVIAAVLIIHSTANKQNFQLFIEHAGVADVSTGESTLDRFSYSSIAWKNFLKAPWGIGAGAFGALPDFNAKLVTGDYQTVGNLYLEVLVEEGIIGLIIFLAFLVLAIKHFWRMITEKKIEGLIALAIFIAIFVQAVSFSALYTITIWAFLAIVWPKTE